MPSNFSDRERILINIAAFLAKEVVYLQSLPGVKERIDNPYSLSHIRVDYGYGDYDPVNHKMIPAVHKKGDLVVCGSSVYSQQNEWLVSFVEGPHGKGDPSGLCIRAIGTDKLCDYGNESFMTITGIPEKFLWEGEKRKFHEKLSKALRKFSSYGHRFRGLEFPEEGVAKIFVGEVWGGLGKKTKPYIITIKYDKKLTVKKLMAEMTAQGFDSREFEVDDGSYDGPMEGLSSFTRESLVQSLSASGIELKPEFKDPPKP